MDLSVIGIFISLAVIVVLALRGLGIAVIGPLAAALLAIFSSMGVLDTLMGPYMKGFVSYASKFFLIFLFASIFGKYMDDSGAAKAIARRLLQSIGHKGPFYVLFSVAMITLLLTLGGVSMFVVIFAVMPIARPLFKKMNIPWHLFIAAFIFGIGSLSMTMIPGSPSIQNIMPTKYLGTTPMAAPLLGIIGSVLIMAMNAWYMNWQLKKAHAKGEGYADSASDNIVEETEDTKILPAFLVSLVPPVAVVIALNVIKLDPVWALIIGCVTAALCFWKNIDSHFVTINGGVTNTAIPIINTCADVGYGMAVAATSGFKIVSDYLMAIPGPPIVALSTATFMMTGITGSASGGLAIVLETLIHKYVAMGLNPEMLHRVVVMACGVFDAMPHSGATVTALAVSGLTHRQAYRHVWYGHVVATLLVMLIIIPLAVLLY
jgi:H+/gluconate symporter-like permease